MTTLEPASLEMAIPVTVDNSKLLAAVDELSEIRRSNPKIPAVAFERILDSLIKGLTFTSVDNPAGGAVELRIVIEVPNSHFERVVALRAGEF